MSIEQDVNKPVAPAKIELFIIDLTMIDGIETTYRFTKNKTAVNFGNETYQPYPIQLLDFEQSSDGAPPRPRLDIANINKLFGTLAFVYGDIVGGKVTQIETFETYLNLSSSISAPPRRFLIRRKISHTKIGLSFELSSPLDRERAHLPRRQMLKRDFPGLGINKIMR
jgi:lambda family phage minor tail protein L